MSDDEKPLAAMTATCCALLSYRMGCVLPLGHDGEHSVGRDSDSSKAVSISTYFSAAATLVAAAADHAMQGELVLAEECSRRALELIEAGRSMP